MTLIASEAAPTATGVRLVAIGPQRWRVLDSSGRALGQLDATADGNGDGTARRYRARRYRAATGRFHDVGEFWRAADALDCLRLLR